MRTLFKACLFVSVMSSCALSAITGYWYLTPTGAGAMDGTSLATAFNTDSLEKYLENGTVANGAVVFVWGGSYTFNATVNFSNSSDGTAVNPVKFIGVKSATTHEGANIVYSDLAIDTADMPAWNLVGYQFVMGDYTFFENIKVTGTLNSMVTTGLINVISNCVFRMTNTTPGARYSVTANGNSCSIINSYFFSDSCGGINTTIASTTKITGCYFYTPRGTTGIAIACGSSGDFSKNTFDRCAISVSLISADHNRIINNTFHKCKNDVDATDAYNIVAIDNLHDSTTNVCYRFTTESDCNTIRNNVFGSTIPNDSQYVLVDTSTVFKDYWKKTGDLKLNASFVISDTTSPAYKAGYIGR